MQEDWLGKLSIFLCDWKRSVYCKEEVDLNCDDEKKG